ncbi:Crp/Fnr family transcriptional regulator [Aliiroseovarius sp. KMU-50]|uniref:Crp/Fnr family transcriptional regulator n=1 Tax=Aliiroseovarius salicola TaxID=3009082 RepID=A0ABT4VY32_9RHOB|nr:Crp/Fnr family transcriptional regulator [Aliiroseovarius sp. KMU-50]MDA5093164.1 Crp/Fnr family transcriptional regulator [Aliiroseovarius sp. KMU-50]
MIAIMLAGFSSLFDRAQDRRFDAGTTVFHTGARVIQVFFVKDGCAVLQRPLANGNAVCQQRAKTGEVVAEASVYADRYHCDCSVTEPTTLAALPLQEFRRALQADAGLSEAWASYLAKAVQRTRMRAEILTLNTVSEKLDAWLAEYGPLPEKGQWQGVASELSVSREAFYRELAKRRSD